MLLSRGSIGIEYSADIQECLKAKDIHAAYDGGQSSTWRCPLLESCAWRQPRC